MSQFTYDETCRNILFAANPILASFVSCALQDLQLTENDEACTDGREARDSGTIYELNAETFGKLAAICDRFADEMRCSIAAALALEPKGEGYEYAREPLTESKLGSTLWLAVTGSGVTFTDDGQAIALVAMAEWANVNSCEGLYFGDDGKPYFYG
jgi:hypothetical protein